MLCWLAYHLALSRCHTTVSLASQSSCKQNSVKDIAKELKQDFQNPDNGRILWWETSTNETNVYHEDVWCRISDAFDTRTHLGGLPVDLRETSRRNWYTKREKLRRKFVQLK
eukprot:6211826-Pleurochrysis_carterae.AAC.1